MYVQIPHLPQRRGDPSQVSLVAFGPLGQGVRGKLERGPQAARGDAHVVQLLWVFAEPDAGLVRQHRRKVAPKDGKGDLAGRQGSVYLRGTEIRSHLGAQAGDREPRPELGGSSRTELESLPQHVDEVPHTVVYLGVRTHLDLDTT